MLLSIYGCGEGTLTEEIVRELVQEKLDEGHKIIFTEHGNDYVSLGSMYRGVEIEQIEQIEIGEIGDPCRETKSEANVTKYWCIEVTLSGSGYSETDVIEFARDTRGKWKMFIKPNFGALE